MGKRSGFERKERDWYPTPLEGMYALLPHLPAAPFRFFEPCAGDGVMIDHMAAIRPDCLCIGGSDLKPMAKGIEEADLLTELPIGVLMADLNITNLPWDRKVMHPLIRALTSVDTPLWTLIDSNWANTEQAGPFMTDLCAKIVQVGRLKWEPGSEHTGKDDCAWYLFDKNHVGSPTFHGRLSRAEKKAYGDKFQPKQPKQEKETA